MRLVFAGTPDVAVASLNALLDSSHQVVAVVSRPDAASGRGRTLRPSPVAARAEELGLEVLKPVKARDPEFAARLREIAPDACPVVAYGALLPQELLDIPSYGWINLHFSLLPRWRGAAPVQHAILGGDQVTGASTFQIVQALDAGAVYATITETIRPDDTSGDLLGRLALTGADLLVQTLDGIEAGTLSAVAQPDTWVSLAPKITVEDAELHWGCTAVELDRQIRACAPAPGAWSTFRGERFKINSATVNDNASSEADQASEVSGLAPGELQITKKAVVVGTGKGSLTLGQVQAQGKKPMAAPDWARGIGSRDTPLLGKSAGVQ